jgi:uncharacterized membrane protein YqiK
MFDIKEQDVLGQTNKLLFNIWQELKRLDIKSIPQEVKPAGEVQCKYCGGTHRNRQSMAACAKKQKKG